MEGLMFWLPVIGLVALVLLSVLTLVDIYAVPQGYLWVIERFGAYNRTQEPGLRFRIRLLERIIEEQIPDSDNPGRTFLRTGKRSTREFMHPFTVEDTITKQGVQIKAIKGVLRTRMKTLKEDPEAARKSTYALEQAISAAIEALSDNVIRGIVGEHDFEYIWNNITETQGKIAAGMLPALDRWGERFLQLDITEIIPSEEVRLIIEQPFKAEKEGEAAKIVSKKAGEAAMLKADGDAQAVKTLAEADKAAAIARAEGTKKALELEATAKYNAIETLAKAYGYKEAGDTTSNNDALKEATKYLLAEEQFEAIGKLGSNGGTILLPVDFAGEGSMFAAISRLLGREQKPKAA